jgi:predicted DNA-binding protein with PD1-like motif
MLRDDVLGTWELVSYTEGAHGGPITYPLGPDALGLIMYTGDGYMSAQIMRRDRPAFDRPETDGGTAEQAAAAAAGYLAYSGPFTVDESSGVLQHQPMVSLLPNWLNHTQIRHSTLDGNHLTLSAVTAAPDGVETISTLLWKRAPEPPPNDRSRRTNPSPILRRAPMHVFEVRNAELMESITKQAAEQGITYAAIVALIGAVDSFTVSTTPAADPTAHTYSHYPLPAEMTATGEIVDGKPHIHAVMAVQGDRAIAGHLHEAQLDTSFARAYLIPSEQRVAVPADELIVFDTVPDVPAGRGRINDTRVAEPPS